MEIQHEGIGRKLTFIAKCSNLLAKKTLAQINSKYIAPNLQETFFLLHHIVCRSVYAIEKLITSTFFTMGIPFLSPSHKAQLT
jgi:hypothetical protein